MYSISQTNDNVILGTNMLGNPGAQLNIDQTGNQTSLGAGLRSPSEQRGMF